MAKENIEQLVEKIVIEIIKDTNLELVDVEYVRERDWYLRVYLDKPGGIEIEDCQKVSEGLEAELDRLDPIPGSYYLEVSSPGLDRPLKKERDFVRHVGDKVEVTTYVPLEGSKNKILIGVLKGLTDGKIVLEIDDQEINLPKEKVAQIRLHVEF